MKVSLSEIFKIFFIIGMQLLGGGYVIVPLLRKYIVEEREWMSDEELSDFYAMSQCIPGIIAGNIAVCAGYKVRGILGAISALMGIIVPCFIIIIMLAQIINIVINYPLIESIFKGVRVAVVVLIILTIKDLWKTSVNSFFTYILYISLIFSLIFLKVSPIFIIILGGVMGLLYGRIRDKNNA